MRRYHCQSLARSNSIPAFPGALTLSRVLMNRRGTKRGTLVAVSSKCIHDRAGHARLENSRPSKLADLVRRLGNRQVTRSTFAMLDLASSRQSESLFGRFMGFLFGHGDRALQRGSNATQDYEVSVRGEECSQNAAIVQGEKGRN